MQPLNWTVSAMTHPCNSSDRKWKYATRILPKKTWVFAEGKRYPIRLTDRVENGKTKRENQVAIDYGTALGGGKNVH